ncbi:hypothetical protein [Mycolicibacterium phlei]|uniref:hypothetical protein n=1 Tax=Mycolicibacterium phlei TaxID=1771 RepID=UPI0010400AB9|nr:hypothetical protein [Mycolicibacterium phlei]MBF4194568.1 hypothetical protein [Mycolicibacterium phlei]
MADQLTQRIAEAIYAELRRQFEGGFDAPLVAPAVGAGQFDGTALIDGEVDLIAAAEAVVAALNLPVLWGVAIRLDSGTYDANANTFYSKAEAVHLLKVLNEMYPDDRRCLVQRFGPSPWVGVLGEEPQ